MIRPLEPSEDTNKKASGTPPKLANTPETVMTTWRSAVAREVKIA